MARKGGNLVAIGWKVPTVFATIARPRTVGGRVGVPECRPPLVRHSLGWQSALPPPKTVDHGNEAVSMLIPVSEVAFLCVFRSDEGRWQPERA